ncbi:MarR family winged helix-turn-helix transcriptional regulator [Kribbella solani]|uniref:DNA-binding MarR family transcriptional regulator n=1 Tax=Kribbella solani TaxID=236067 RepID=A0A841DN41_9ACTN|nr:MarR family transcriptional regulator [Kribbella solani]MBB5980083.1 DNA-binding MarR family transcriptional regulator [Kribbella solani]
MAGTKITPPENPLALEHQVCFALAVAARTVIALYRPVLEPMGLTHPQYLVMLALWEREPVSVKDLSGMLQLEPATLSPLLKRLEAAGLLSRARSVMDERSLAVSLTDEGRALRDQALEVPPAIVQRLGLDLGELMDLHDRLTMVITAATTEQKTEQKPE